ncbi:MAG: nitroreductase family protein [Fimbriimonas sp.]
MTEHLDVHALPKERAEALLQAIAHRRSLGLSRLRPHPVDHALIERMLQAANWAPSHEDTEPWRFTVFSGAGRLQLADLFGEAYRADAGDAFREDRCEAHRGRAMNAPVWISIGVLPKLREDGTLQMREEEELMAVACAVQNLHLAASAFGLAGMWHSKGTSVHPVVAHALGLAPPARLLGFFFCGWPAVEWPAGERGAWEEKVTWVDGGPG